jgi:thiamine biosynthesis lipoprotein
VIDIGGELRVSGRRGDGELWRVGIASPAEDTPIAFLLAPQTNAVATSGDYRNFYFSEGRRVSHTIDPARGEPVDHPLSSVTVIDPLGARADALATALMVMGPEAGFAFAEQRGIPALFLTRTDASFTTHFTGSMRGYLLER